MNALLRRRQIIHQNPNAVYALIAWLRVTEAELNQYSDYYPAKRVQPFDECSLLNQLVGVRFLTF